ncbi:MAG TPA: hypothetical protein ENK11_02805, partial [Phycisphaerales bacterium]|nr:hypothetical protein [Phycisphaerales bacterium]
MSWKQQDGWNKPGDRSHRRPRDRGKPAATTKEDSGEISTWEASKMKSEKRRKRRAMIWVITGVLVALFLLVAFAPTIAAAFAPGVIASNASDAIAGRVEVGSVRLGWFGSQRIQNVRLYDDKGEKRGEITAKTDKGLFGLLLAGGNYGAVTISGELDASADADGRTFLQHTVGVKTGGQQTQSPGGPSSKPPAAPPSLPGNLRATLRLDNLRITYAGPSSDAVRVDELRGEISLPGGGRVDIDLSAKIQRKSPDAALFDDAGTVRVTAEAADITDPDGAINTKGFSLDAKVEARDIATALLDLLPDFAGKGEAALGPTLSATISANGPAGDLAVTLTTDSESITADAPLTVDLVGGSLTSSG